MTYNVFGGTMLHLSTSRPKLAKPTNLG